MSINEFIGPFCESSPGMYQTHRTETGTEEKASRVVRHAMAAQPARPVAAPDIAPAEAPEDQIAMLNARIRAVDDVHGDRIAQLDGRLREEGAPAAEPRGQIAMLDAGIRQMGADNPRGQRAIADAIDSVARNAAALAPPAVTPTNQADTRALTTARAVATQTMNFLGQIHRSCGMSH